MAPVDFFISYTSTDRAWAEWVAGQLQEGGYSTTPPFPGTSTRGAQPWFPGGRPGDRLRPLDDFSSVPDRLTAIWLGLEGTPGAVPNGIAVDPTAFRSLNDLLDALFVGYLHRVVSPYSYGAEWILMTGQDVVAAPAGWVRDPTQPIRRLDAGWAASVPLEAVGLGEGASASIHRPAALQVYAVVTDSKRLGRIVAVNPKAMAILKRHLTVVHDDSYRDRAVQVVLCDWMRQELAGKILEDKALTSEKLDELSRAYWLEPWLDPGG